MAETSWEKFVFTTINSLFSTLNIYVCRGSRRTQSATTFFNKKAKNGEESDARNSIRKRDEANPDA